MEKFLKVISLAFLSAKVFTIDLPDANPNYWIYFVIVGHSTIPITNDAAPDAVDLHNDSFVYSSRLHFVLFECVDHMHSDLPTFVASTSDGID